MEKNQKALQKEQTETREAVKQISKQLKQMQMLQNLMAKKINQVSSSVGHPG